MIRRRGAGDEVTDAVQVLAAGTAAGLVYALLAIGLVVIHRATRVLDFAHGEIAVLGAVAIAVLGSYDWPLWLSLPAAAALCALAGLLVHLVAVAGSPWTAGTVAALAMVALVARYEGPLAWAVGLPVVAVLAAALWAKEIGRLTPGWAAAATAATSLLVILGVAISDAASSESTGNTLGALALLVVGTGGLYLVLRIRIPPLTGQPRWILGTFAMAAILHGVLEAVTTDRVDRSVGLFDGLGSVTAGGLDLPGGILPTILVAGVCVLAADRLVHHSRLGRTLGAVSHDREAATLVGIDVGRTLAAAWAFAAVLAGAAGILGLGIVTGPDTQDAVSAGPLLTVLGLAAALLGGLDSPRGAIVGGMLTGMGLAIVDRVLAAGDESLEALRDPIVIGIMLVLVLVFPRGVTGSRPERVA